MSEAMDDQALLRILKSEASDAGTYYESEMAKVQADALDRYHAKPFGNEIEGRSAVVTHDIEDTVNWVMPHLMRLFLQSDELVTCEDAGLDDGDPSIEQAQELLKHAFFKDNAGETVIHDFAFDAMVQRIGIARVYWKDPEPKAPRIIEGVHEDQLARYANDPEYEILEADQEMKEEAGQPYTCFTLKVRRTPKMGRSVIECVAPEEFRISRQARSIAEADYHGWHRQEFLAEIVRQFPDSKRELLELTGESGDNEVPADLDQRKQARFPDEPYSQSSGTDGDALGRKKVERHVEYLRCDYDGDGVVELRRVTRVGSVILENDQVDESEFEAWTPIRVSHRLVGRSLVDTLLDLQKIRTGLTRAALDSLTRSLAPRTAINTEMATKDTVNDLLDHDIGGVVRVNGDVRQAVAELVVPDVSATALQAIEYFDRSSEQASGVTRHAQGIAPEAITKTKGGIENLQAAANARIELLARWMGLGLEKLFGKLLRLLIAHQDGPRWLKITGQRVAVDPRRWSDDMTVSVHVGTAAESRELRLMHLGVIAQKQEAILLQAGPGNPMVSFKEYGATLALMAQAMGFKSATRFFKEIPEGWEPPPPGPDPKMAEVQQKGQLASAEMQQKAQLAQAEVQQKGQLQAAELQGKQQLAQLEAQIQAQMGEQKAATERAIAQMKLANEQEINGARMAMERDLALMRMSQERDLALMRMAQEKDLAMHAAATKPTAKTQNGSGSFIDGGRLDA